MREVVLYFHDGEMIRAEIGELLFDHPLLEADVTGADPNNERALFPVSSIRQVVVSVAPAPAEASEWDRAAFHFIDGHVMRAHISPGAILGQFGGVWEMVEPGSHEVRTIGIPYTSLKGVFELRQWDSRSPRQKGSQSSLDHFAKILAERAEPKASKARKRPLMKRVGPQLTGGTHDGSAG